jgi:hypothetical protein
MPQAVESTQVGKREALADIIANVESDACPVTSLLEKRKRPGNVIQDWQLKAYKKKGHGGVRDGKDASDFDFNPRSRVHAVAQKTWDPRGVSDFAEESDVAGVKSELAEQTADAFVTVKQTIERRVCSTAECAVQDEADPLGANETRGLFKWLSPTAQALYPVPEKYRPTSAQYSTVALSLFTEDVLKGMARAAWKRRMGNQVKLMGVLGIDLKAKFSDFTRYDDTAASKVSVRQFNQDAESKALVNIIDRLVLDTGVIDLMASAHLATNADTGEDTAATHRSGLFLDMEMGGLAYTRMPRAFKLPYAGGGHKVVIDAIFMLMMDNPSGCFSAEITADT